MAPKLSADSCSVCVSVLVCVFGGVTVSPSRPSQMSADMATDHVNGNGTEEPTEEPTEPMEPMDTTAVESRSEHFPALLEAGLPQQVAEKLDELYVSGEKLNTFFFFLFIKKNFNFPRVGC